LPEAASFTTLWQALQDSLAAIARRASAPAASFNCAGRLAAAIAP
jgi:hypothetical protein